MIKVVCLKTLTRVRKLDIVDKILFCQKITLSSQYIKNGQINS